jgi:DNA-binding NarL/FixJ family response regulator
MLTSTNGDGRAVRVLIVDNHPIIRGGLTAVLSGERDMEVVGEAVDGLSAVDAASRLRPDVVVMDLSMPGVDGIEATRRLRAAQPEIKVLVLSCHREPGHVQSAMEAGAAGYVLKRTAVGELVSGLRAVASGGTFLDSAVSAQVLSAARNDTAIPTALSQREAEVVKLIARGHAMKEIAATLQISARTLETYKTRAMEKLGLKSRADLIRYAHQHGWLESM